MAIARGAAHPDAEVTVNGPPPVLRQGAGWAWEQSVDNSSGPVWQPAVVRAERAGVGAGGGSVHTEKPGALYIPPAMEVMGYDADGNLTSDGRWLYTWDAENRLTGMETREGARLAGVPHMKLIFGYDAMGRRITKKVFRADAESAGVLVQRESLIFLYDGWNLIAEFEASPSLPVSSSPRLLRSYEWGPALDGIGGTGGLLLIRQHSGPSSLLLAPCYDGNGNITELINLATGQVEARYEYGPFGEPLRAEGGSIAGSNPFRWATKYFDVETGLSYYGHRYYSAELGRWISRDPIGESGGVNLYAMVSNDAVNRIDVLGLAEACDICPVRDSRTDQCCNRCGSRTDDDGTVHCIVACTSGGSDKGGGCPTGGGGGPQTGGLCYFPGDGPYGGGWKECLPGGVPSNETPNSRTKDCGGGGSGSGQKTGWAAELYGSMNDGDSSGFDGGKAEADEFVGEIGQGILDTGKIMASTAAQSVVGGWIGKGVSKLVGVATGAVSKALGMVGSKIFSNAAKGGWRPFSEQCHVPNYNRLETQVS